MAKQITQKKLDKMGSNLGMALYAVQVLCGIIGIIMFYATDSNMFMLLGAIVAVCAIINTFVATQPIMALVLGAVAGMVLVGGSTGNGVCIGACFVGVILGAYGIFKWYLVKNNL